MSYFSDFQELNGGYVTFGGNPKGGKISSKGKIKTGKLDFEDVYFVKELKFNLFSVTQMCDKKNKFLFTDSECLVLSPDFKLPNKSQVLLRVPRENNMYNVNLKDIVPSGDLTCLFAKATIDEYNLWHRRLGHVYFKTINKLVKGNLVRGLPTKVFENNNTCVACKKGKQNRASCKTKPRIKREFSIPRTPQQNGIAERKNRTLIEAARTMLADSLLPIPFWAEAVNTACYVQNRVLVTKPHNKTPYKLLHGRTLIIGFMRLFGCPMTILNTFDPLGKVEGKVDEGFLVGYSINSKAFRVLNSKTRIVQETLHVNFLENKPNIVGTGPTWLFDIDSLTRTMNYQPVTIGNQSNLSAGDAAFDGKEHDAEKPESAVNLSPSSSALSGEQDDMTKKKDKGKSPVEYFTGNRDLNADFEDYSDDSSNNVSATGPIVPTAGQNYSNNTNPISADGPSNSNTSPTHGKFSLRDAYQPPDMLEKEDIAYSDNKNVGAEADFNNLETSITIFNDDFHTCMFACFLSQEEPKRVYQALKDPSWIKAMQEELLQFKIQKVWILVDFLHRKREIGTKWVYRNKKDERGIVVRNKARLITQGHTQEEGIDYEEVFAPVARIEAIRLFLAYASFIGFMVYQMDVKSAFLYRTIEEEVYICQPSGFEDSDHPDKVYKVVKALYGLHQAPRAWYETLANYLLENGFHRGWIDQKLFIKKQKGDILRVQIYVDDIIFGATNKDLCKSFEKLMKDKFQMSSMGELTFFLGLQVKQKKDGIFISQDKYVAEILKKFRLIEGKSASTPIDTEKPLLKDPDGEDVDVHIYRSMIGSLMYLTSSRLDIMFASNDVTRLQTLVDKKKVVVTEAAIRDTLHLDDAEGVDCLPNEEIFTELARMGYEKPSMMASAVICLSTGCKFNFSKYIFDSLVRNVDSSLKFYMYPRFIHLIIQNQLGDLSTHTTKYISHALTQKAFANIRRVGKGCSGVETPLFEGMLVAKEPEEQGDEDEQGNANNAAEEPITVVSEDDVEDQSIPSPTLPTPPPQPQDIPSTSQA
nr:hypothetical protein [Tanacetum cinerariifolium]